MCVRACVHVCVCVRVCVCVCVCSWSSRSGCESRGASSTGHAARARAHAPAHRPLRSLAHAQRCLSGGGRGATHCAPETERACVLVSGKGLCGRGSCFDHDQSTSPCRLRCTMRLPALLFRGENLALLFREGKGSQGSFRTLVRQYVRLRLVHRHSCSRWPPDSTASCRTRRRAVLSVVCAPLTGRGAAGGAVRRHPGPRHGALPPAGPPICLPLFPLGLPPSFSSSRPPSLLLLSLPLPLIFLVPCPVFLPYGYADGGSHVT